MEAVNSTWPISDTGRMAYLFAEQMLELVYDYSWDNYRHFALDTISRLAEASQLCSEVQKETIPRQALDPLLEELAWSTANDPVLKYDPTFDPDVFIDFIHDKNRSIQAIKVLLDALISKLSPIYKDECQHRLLECLKHPVEKILFINCARFYCAHLVSSGYHRKYVEESIKDVKCTKLRI